MYGILLIIIKVQMHQIKVANVIVIVETFVKLHGLISYHVADEIEKYFSSVGFAV